MSLSGNTQHLQPEAAKALKFAFSVEPAFVGADRAKASRAGDTLKRPLLRVVAPWVITTAISSMQSPEGRMKLLPSDAWYAMEATKAPTMA